MTHQTRNVRVRLRTWTGQPDPDLAAWLGDAPHHFEGDQLVIHGEGADEDVQPRPGWQLVGWPDGVVTVASARTATRLYEPEGQVAPAEFRDQVEALRDDLRGITGARWIADALDKILNPPPPIKCSHCQDHGVVPDLSTRDHNGYPHPKPCPLCQANQSAPEKEA
jgi:hypothetical protein